jgi:hypothetical protein
MAFTPETGRAAPMVILSWVGGVGPDDTVVVAPPVVTGPAAVVVTPPAVVVVSSAVPPQAAITPPRPAPRPIVAPASPAYFRKSRRLSALLVSRPSSLVSERSSSSLLIVWPSLLMTFIEHVASQLSPQPDTFVVPTTSY